MTKRGNKRTAFRNTIAFGPQKPPEHLSFTTDISETGVYIKTNRVFPTGTALFMVIDTPEGKCEAEGVVAWAKKAPRGLVHVEKNGMGIKFTKVDERLLDMIRKKKG